MKRTFRLLIPLILILGLFGAACSNDDDDSGSNNNDQNETQSGLKVGDQAPAFSLPSSTGDMVSLADYANQPVLLYFHMAVG